MIISHLSHSLTHIHTMMREQGDARRADKIAELAGKLQTGKAAIAFSGHFSAGKSSLINALCGRKLLPTGPIPTSANLVVIEDGEEGAVVYRGDIDGTSHSVVRVAVDRLEEYCKDGAAYRRIEIRYSSKLLTNRLYLLDTPGVDSTDETHKLATESSLHLADAFMYVTDYNHVLSEMNFNFTKKLQEWGKPLYIIVNQIDKHRESEISFQDYTANVKAAFRSWGVFPDGFLFVSVREPEYPGSEWNKLLWLIDRLKEQSDKLLTYSTTQSARVLIQSAFGDRTANGDDESSRLADAAREVERLDEEIRAIEQDAGEIDEQFRRELLVLIDNAQIMPASTRELAARYLQSRRPNFKVGLWLSRKRTKAEISERLNAFYLRLKDSAEKQLVWHLNQLIRHYADQYGDPGISPETLEIELSAESLADEVKESAGFTDEYTMTYCNLITERIKSFYRRKAANALEAALSPIVRSMKRRTEQLASSRAEAANRLERLRDQAGRQQAKQRHEQELMVLLDGNDKLVQVEWPNPEQAPFAADQHSTMDNPFREVKLPGSSTSTLAANNSSFSDTESVEAFHYSSMMEEAALGLEKTAEQLEPVRPLEQIRKTLLTRAEKLRGNRFTVALFGAFSAGKSSLANALFGERVLPVSPNPTTAAINSILPPTIDNPHRTAIVRMKSAEALLADVQHSLSMLGLDGETAESVKEAITMMRRLNGGEQVPAKGKPHLSFLRAVETGYAAESAKLGTAWSADFDTYRRYVSEEDKSCFVDSIDLHFETGFGRQGVVLVDTPGADSIHARHTGVTFTYMKNADAVLFVTYYNHAFSQADKQFLLQLGRVKDTFDLDKMFFLVNAADLAESDEELRLVLNYVENQLLQHGIRSPRLFAVSSRMALEAKQSGDRAGEALSGLTLFEREFSHFAQRELGAAMVRSAYGEIERAAGRLRQYIAGLQASEEQSKMRAEEQRAIGNRLIDELRRSAAEVHTEPVRKELSELLHHVKQRCSYRFGDLYKDAFHPSVLQEDGRNIELALQSAWKQLHQSVSIDVSQELLATTLRMERYVCGKVSQWIDLMASRIASELPEFIADEWREPVFETPFIRETLGSAVSDGKILRKQFKSAKAFFEGEGRQTLRNVLESDIAAALSAFVEDHHHRLGIYYDRMLVSSIASAAEYFVDQLELYIGMSAREIEMDISMEELTSRLASIESYIR